MKQSLKDVLSILLATMIVSGLIGCSGGNDLYRNNVPVEWMDSDYVPEYIYLDNDWLQQKSISAAEGLDLQKTDDFFAYLDILDPILLRYFVQDHEITNILHYSNGIWAVRYALPEDEIVLGYDVTIYYIDETSGEIRNYECWSRGGTKPWE